MDVRVHQTDAVKRNYFKSNFVKVLNCNIWALNLNLINGRAIENQVHERFHYGVHKLDLRLYDI